MQMPFLERNMKGWGSFNFLFRMCCEGLERVESYESLESFADTNYLDVPLFQKVEHLQEPGILSN
jgi:hypothetical protein